MAAKDKANQLIDSFLNIKREKEWEDKLNKFEAVQCALIAVGEFLSFQENLFITEGSIAYAYWQEVKKELENILT